jgi:outer membrane scaffolding protein for murein synthesis (MipA/OmpV family)
MINASFTRYKDSAVIRLLLAALLAVQGTVAMSRELPLWEVGVGLFPFTFPAYRGSEDQQYYLLPFPYLVYRGDYLRMDREGLRARLFDTDRVQLNISVNASAPARSDDNNAREGMPDLDPTVEIGPSLNILLAKLTDKHSLKMKLPVRSVIATDLGGTEQAGWIFNPHLKLESEDVFGGWDAGLSLGPLFGNGKYHAYYYAVDQQYATATRPAYSASGGYSGTLALASLSRRFNRIWMGGFIRYDNLSGAQFEDSPLFETDHSLMAGIAIAWIFKQSSRTLSE